MNRASKPMLEWFFRDDVAEQGVEVSDMNPQDSTEMSDAPLTELAELAQDVTVRAQRSAASTLSAALPAHLSHTRVVSANAQDGGLLTSPARHREVG